MFANSFAHAEAYALASRSILSISTALGPRPPPSSPSSPSSPRAVPAARAVVVVVVPRLFAPPRPAIRPGARAHAPRDVIILPSARAHVPVDARMSSRRRSMTRRIECNARVNSQTTTSNDAGASEARRGMAEEDRDEEGTTRAMVRGMTLEEMGEGKRGTTTMLSLIHI